MTHTGPKNSHGDHAAGLRAEPGGALAALGVLGRMRGLLVFAMLDVPRNHDLCSQRHLIIRSSSFQRRLYREFCGFLPKTSPYLLFTLTNPGHSSLFVLAKTNGETNQHKNTDPSVVALPHTLGSLGFASGVLRDVHCAGMWASPEIVDTEKRDEVH